MPLTMKQILSATPASRKELAEDVRVRNLKIGTSKTKGVPVATAKTLSIDPKSGVKKMSQYVTFIEYYPSREVKVSCSCEDFLYRWEYVLAKKGASYITYSNGEKSRQTNPANIPGCCKHVVALHKAVQKAKSQ